MKDNKNTPLNKGELLKLVSADSEMNAEFIISLLASEGIEVIKRFKGSGSYLNITQGRNYQGVDLFVLENDLEEAKSILNASVDPEEMRDEVKEVEALEDTSEDDLSSISTYNKTQIARGLLALMLLMAVIAIVATFFSNL